MDSHRAPEATNNGNTDVEALVTSAGAMALTTTGQKVSHILDLPIDVLVEIIRQMTKAQRVLFALTSRACREIYNEHFLRTEEYIWERRIANLIYLARDDMTVVACNGKPRLHPIKLDIDEPWDHKRMKPCDFVNPGSRHVQAGFQFADDVFIRHIHVETILKFVRKYNSLDAEQRQFLAKLLTPQDLPQGSWYAIHAPAQNTDRDLRTLRPQPHGITLQLMQLGDIKFYKVERQFEMRVVINKDKNAEGGQAPGIIAKLTLSLKETNLDEIPPGASFETIQTCNHRPIESALQPEPRTGLPGFIPTDLSYNLFAAKMLDNSGEQLEWTCSNCATSFTIDSPASDAMTVKVFADLGGQGLPFSNEWLSHVTRQFNIPDVWDKRGLDEVFEKDRWLAPDSE
ncbi:hypothetical protein F5X68DRAFT_195224 [Plectosphaerella plurivora]|uniref:F-box domain-containing protein n=1 Tax=Plectosphaerella plurivora TaxID=936078 RepID=A0A9P8V1E3_9PEZI|nr:hypothetical protein F5X68DRAFT_195224 [Plectosphaerella plurivora]